MKIDRCGLDRVEHWIRPTLPSVVTIPVEKDGREFAIYVCSLDLLSNKTAQSLPGYRGEERDKELQAVAKEIANKLEIEPAE